MKASIHCLRLPLGPVFLSGLLALSCAPAEEKASLPAALRDPMVVTLDGLAPANGFDGQGSLFLADGWGRPEGDGGDGDWGSMAWVVGREATFHLLLPAGKEMDFFARGLPFPWAPGSPLQQMELLAGDRVLGRAEMIRDWQDIRIPLPESLPGNRMLTLRLRFRHALKPSDLAGGGGDSRSLAAAFTQLALIPREVHDPRAFLAAHDFDPETGEIALPAGGGLRLPLPPASRLQVALDVRSRCRNCKLSLELTGPGEAVLPLETREEEDRTLTASFDTAPGTFQSLWLRVTAPLSAVPLERSREPLELTLRSVTAAARLRESREEPPHVFIYMVDTLRADVLGPYGGRPSLTPRISAFADEAVTYLRARSSSTWTLPSVVSLLTGLYPDRHGVTVGLQEYDPQRLQPLQQMLRGRGYRTLGISHSFIVSPTYGLDAGFDSFYYHDHLNSHALRSQEARSLLASWLGGQAGGRPLFTYIHTVDPHAPYAPPAELREPGPRHPAAPAAEEGLPSVFAGKVPDRATVAYLRALYDGEVRYADRELGRFVDLLKWLGLWSQSYVILVGDHGEEFTEHGGFEHGTNLFEETLRVPLIVKYPEGKWAGRRIDRPVSLVDVAPTLLADLVPGAGPELDGQALPGPETTGRAQPVYFAVSPLRLEQAPVNLRGLAVDDLKCIENLAGVDTAGLPAPRFQAFDLAADPGERRPLAADGIERCRQILEAWSKTRERHPRQHPYRQVTPETLERLRALGYVK